MRAGCLPADDILRLVKRIGRTFLRGQPLHASYVDSLKGAKQPASTAKVADRHIKTAVFHVRDEDRCPW
eukprot:scaffold131695_cov69-Phaeocystis_antarctica.AAC.4